MKLVVTTSRSLLHVDTLNGEYTPLHRGAGLYYGLAPNGGGFAVGARHRMVSSEVSPDLEQGSILMFDEAFALKSSIRPEHFSLRDIHEIAWHADSLWVTCSYDNKIAVWDGQRWDEWYPLGRADEEPWDRNHFNSLFFEDEFVWLVAHNKGPSELLKFHRESRELESRISLGHAAHNLWRKGEHLYTCSSAEGVIVGTDGFRLEVGGFPRGVAFSGGLRCIGISEVAERKDRDLTSARIRVFDDDWASLCEIDLPNEGLILDIKVLHEASARDE